MGQDPVVIQDPIVTAGQDPVVVFVILSVFAFIGIGIYCVSRGSGEIQPKPMTFWRTVAAVLMACWILAVISSAFRLMER